MIPISFSVKNLCQHDKREYQYKTGITGIFGENGAGKSNFAVLGQLFSLTGELPSGGSKAKKSSLLQWGAKSGHTEHVFSNDGLIYTLKRSLGKTKASLTWTLRNGEEKSIAGHSQVNEKLEDIYGSPMSLIQEQCFVPQGTLTNCIEMTHAARMTYFQRLIPGLTRAESIRGMLQNGINQLPVYPDRTVRMGELREEIKQFQMQLLEFKGSKIETDEMVEHFRLALVASKDNQGLPTEAVHFAKMRDLDVKLKNKQAENQQYKASNAELLNLTVVKPPTELEEKVSGATQNLLSLYPEYKKAKDLMCPTCKRAFEFESETKRQLIISNYECLKLEEQRIRQELKQAKQMYSVYQRQLDKQTTITPALVRLEQDIKHLNTTIGETAVEVFRSAAQVKKEQDSQHFYNEAYQLQNKLSTDIAVRETRLETHLKQLLDYDDEYQKNIEILKLKKKLERSREILHRDNLPRLILLNILQAMNARIAMYLNKFSVNFTAHLSSDFDFLCEFPEKGVTDVSAKETLSGGQKVALALAFHFAKSDILNSSLPILVLDEPTAYLNATNREALCALFGEARKFAEAGLYIFVSTHEPMLEAAMSHSLTIE